MHDPVADQSLSESEVVTISKKPHATLRLHGFVWGGGLTIRWDGTHLQVTSAMVFPSMKVNGQKVNFAVLKDGDVIEVGRNRFRFLTE